MDKAAKRIKKTTTQILSNYNSMENFTAMIESKEVGDIKPIPSQEPYLAIRFNNFKSC